MEIKMPEYIDLNVIPHLRDIRYISLDIFKIKKKKNLKGPSTALE
jgi:hypothetical protein